MIEIGKTYLTIWGDEAEIRGYVMTSRGWGDRPAVYDKGKVWASSGHHYDIKTGKNTSGGHKLIDLPPKEEIAFLEKRLIEIRTENSLDKLKLVERNLKNMRGRIESLSLIVGD